MNVNTPMRERILPDGRKDKSSDAQGNFPMIKTTVNKSVTGLSAPRFGKISLCILKNAQTFLLCGQRERSIYGNQDRFDRDHCL